MLLKACSFVVGLWRPRSLDALKLKLVGVVREPAVQRHDDGSRLVRAGGSAAEMPLRRLLQRGHRWVLRWCVVAVVVSWHCRPQRHSGVIFHFPQQLRRRCLPGAGLARLFSVVIAAQHPSEGDGSVVAGLETILPCALYSLNLRYSVSLPEASAVVAELIVVGAVEHR